MPATEIIPTITRPQRWDSPFGPDMTDAVVDRLLARREIAAIEAGKFPPPTPLREILRNDTRIVRFKPGDLIVREGDYGNSAFLVLSGKVRVVLAPGLSREILGRSEAHEKNWWQALSQLWKNRRVPEVREKRAADILSAESAQRPGAASADKSAAHLRVFLQDVPAILNEHRTALLQDGALFGELAALG